MKLMSADAGAVRLWRLFCHVLLSYLTFVIIISIAFIINITFFFETGLSGDLSASASLVHGTRDVPLYPLSCKPSLNFEKLKI